ncbi:MAG TPA: PRC-barrel domain-containing protein [Jatrophihabitantaceae bacterium]|nr:PRC-barrel domain-containing protein [Jatrophihabitantaceae bacterium]
MDAADLTSELVGRDVLDAAGQHLGRVDGLFRDFDTPDLVFAAVAMIRRGRRRLVFVPLVGATIQAASVTLRCGALLARRAPQIRPGCGLPVELEADLYRHYDLAYRRREHGEARLLAVGQGKHRR